MRLFKFLTSFACAAFVLAGCGGGGGSAGVTGGGGGSTPLTTTAPSGLTLQNGEAQSYTISGGTAPYTATSNNSSVAVATVTGNALTIGGVGPGTASISVIDSKNASIVASVTVAVQDLATTAPSTVTLATGVGSAQIYNILGGVAPYTVTSSNTNVAVVDQPSPTQFRITGQTAGTASAVIRDKTGKTVNVAVSVSPALALFTTAPNTLSLTVTTPKTTVGPFTIQGGIAPYTVSTSNPVAVQVSQSGSTFTITALEAGSSTVSIRDATGSGSVTIAVTVAAQNITVNPPSATSLVGLANYSYITGGVKPYTAVSTFAGGASVDIGTLDASGVFHVDSANGNVIRMTPLIVADPNQIVVTDATGQHASFALTSKTGSASFTFAPETLTISTCTATPITLNLYGGAGTINVFSSDPSQFTAVAGTGVVTVTPKNPKAITPGSYTITAVDGVGAVAKATINATLPAAACP